ncbi:hypothetical protein [Peribacillus tepidiphilus]|jgi:hypothetical protein|uniref:hypothetical protein n=1 Tax=Peribacillus tepidiphilus TaxID=2652445 RepID=UPI001291711D|nr:hypothetical protein [Peribacillus tepidiphilus]
MGLFDDIEEKFMELEDGNYVVRIDGFSRERTVTGAKPLRWELTLLNDHSSPLPTKFSHIETNAGFQILLRELKSLGYNKPANSRELEEILNSLIGCIVEVHLNTTNREEGYREIKLLRKLY